MVAWLIHLQDLVEGILIHNIAKAGHDTVVGRGLGVARRKSARQRGRRGGAGNTNLVFCRRHGDG